MPQSVSLSVGLQYCLESYKRILTYFRKNNRLNTALSFSGGRAGL